MDILDKIKDLVAPKAFGAMTLSQFEDYDIQCPAFFRAKDEERDQVLAEVRANPFVEKADVTGRGFLSVRLRPSVFGALSFDGDIPKPQRFLIDYGGMNVAKKLHIGHIRSMFIGDSMARLLKSLGHDVILQNHLGDWGNQFGPLLEYMMENHPDTATWNGDNLTEGYKKATLLKDDPLWMARAEKRAVMLQDKSDKETVSAWERAVAVSMADNLDWFKRFNLLLGDEHTAGESTYAGMVQNVISDLVAKGLAEENDDGSVVAHFQKLSPLVLRKKNGAALYAAFDLAAIFYRRNHFHPDKVIYVVDKRQALHFQQVFDLAVRAGWAGEGVLHHVAFGTILGADKKPLKTRSGDALFLDDLLREGFSSYDNSLVGQKNASHPAALAVKEASVIGALKYYDLHLTPSDDYVFDWEYVLSTQGQSAPYIQNAVVRIDSVLAKVDNRLIASIQSPPETLNDFLRGVQNALQDVAWNDLSEPAKKLTMATLTSFSSFAGQKPHDVVSSLMRMAKSMHAFYENTQVLGGAQEKDHLALLHATGLSLVYGASLLGVSTFPSVVNTPSPKAIKP